MANVHGFSSAPNSYNSQGSSNLRNNSPLTMLGIKYSDLLFMDNEISHNRIPFVNLMVNEKPARQESLIYTLRAVLCPAMALFSVSSVLLVVIWIMYIVCLCFGITEDYYTVLAPTQQTLQKFGAFNYYVLKEGQVWRLITAVFLHQNLWQITMSTLGIVFVVAQLELCCNPFVIGVIMLGSAISGNITIAIFGKMYFFHAGTAPIIYGGIGGLIAYLIINWQTLMLIRFPLCYMIGIVSFFSILFPIGTTIGYAGYLGGLIGGLFCTLAILPGIRTKGWIIIGIGTAGLAVFWLTMFLVFYLAV